MEGEVGDHLGDNGGTGDRDRLGLTARLMGLIIPLADLFKLFNIQGLNPISVENSSFSPHPKSLSQEGRGTLKLAPLLPKWEKGLGDEGQQIQTTCFKLDRVILFCSQNFFV